MENRKPVILQGHMDMVPQANKSVKHNFETDPILPRVDGEWVTATETTLGADNGIGISSILAILESKILTRSARSPSSLTMRRRVCMEPSGWNRANCMARFC